MTRALAERLRRLRHQLRTLGELHERELADLGERGATIARLHADELRIVTDELEDIAAELAASAEPEARAPATPRTDATRSPKRERWLAEQERLEHPPPRSRREFLRGRDAASDPEREA